MSEKNKNKTLIIVKNLCRFVAVCMLIVIIVFFVAPKIMKQKKGPEIISVTTLEKILNVSDLSTFEAVYNGVAKVHDENSRIMVKYYVAYSSKITAGIDFEQLAISVDDENNVIYITLPEVKITDVNVDITSMDYIFYDLDANTSTVSEEAYQACIEDATSESHAEEKIYDLARQNAINIVRALVNPFVEQLDNDYKIEIE